MRNKKLVRNLHGAHMTTVGDVVEIVDNLREKNKVLGEKTDFTPEQTKMISDLQKIISEQIGINQVRKKHHQSVTISEEAEEILRVLQNFLRQTHTKTKEHQSILVQVGT